ncbi:hypothetical protein ACFQ3C_13265 [Seohaeicola saemankumensis]|uniref:Argininosuccinate lyase n=1 Tax=Seohaeicola saemankumensis TaxID=481181 RepID=A0ABW3TG10_9RHOB|nr:hypothetical protein [Paracoccaceae bacterium]
MKAFIFGSLCLLALAACGVEGAPLRPSLDAGVSITPGGIYPSASVGVNKGPVSLRVGL